MRPMVENREGIERGPKSGSQPKNFCKPNFILKLNNKKRK